MMLKKDIFIFSKDYIALLFQIPAIFMEDINTDPQ